MCISCWGSSLCYVAFFSLWSSICIKITAFLPIVVKKLVTQACTSSYIQKHTIPHAVFDVLNGEFWHLCGFFSSSRVSHFSVILGTFARYSYADVLLISSFWWVFSHPKISVKISSFSSFISSSTNFLVISSTTCFLQRRKAHIAWAASEIFVVLYLGHHRGKQSVPADDFVQAGCTYEVFKVLLWSADM